MIPGMTGPVAMNSEFVPLSLTSVSVVARNWSENTNTIAYPADFPLRAGDVALHFGYVTRSSNNAPSLVVPGGYTNLFSQTGNNTEPDPPDGTGRTRTIINSRILDGTETGTLSCMQHDRYEGNAILIVRGNIRISGVTLNGIQHQSSGTNPSQQNINSDTGGNLITVFGWMARTITPPLFTENSPAFATLMTDPNNFRLGYTTYNTNPADHVVDTDLGNLGSVYCMLCSGWFKFS